MSSRPGPAQGTLDINWRPHNSGPFALGSNNVCAKVIGHFGEHSAHVWFRLAYEDVRSKQQPTCTFDLEGCGPELRAAVPEEALLQICGEYPSLTKLGLALRSGGREGKISGNAKVHVLAPDGSRCARAHPATQQTNGGWGAESCTFWGCPLL